MAAHAGARAGMKVGVEAVGLPVQLDDTAQRGMGAVSSQVVMLAAFGSTALINYAFSLVMGRLLLPGDFGLLAFAQTVLLLGALIVGSGISWSLAATIAASPVDQRGSLIRGALLANLGLGVFVGALITLLFALGPLRAGMDNWAITLFVVLTLLSIAVISVTGAAMEGAERFGAVAAIQSVEIACKAAGGIVLTLFGFGVDGAMAGFLIGGVAGALVGLYAVCRGLHVPLWGVATFARTRAAGPIFVSLLGLALLQNLDFMAVKLFSGPDRTLAGYYQAASILATAPYYLVFSAVIPVLVPKLAREDSVAGTGAIVGQALRLLAAAIIPIEIVLMLAPRPALEVLLSSRYTAAAATLRILAIGNSALMVLAVLAAAYQATGRARTPAGILLTVTAIEAVVLSICVPHWHGVGAATIFSVATGVALGALWIAYGRALGRAQLAPLWRWLLRWVLASGIGLAGGLLLMIGSGSIFFAIGLGCVCYLVVALKLRLVGLSWRMVL